VKQRTSPSPRSAQDGETLTGRQVTFASDNPEIATVSEVGRVTAVSSGLTVITATVEERAGPRMSQ
jgi:uncharacterized protein YjdB